MPFQSRVLTPVNSPTHCDRSFKRLLSWRADQKKSGKGGRKRAPRSQREKMASAIKHSKNC